MSMCYAGALAMPSNYALMNEEEMTYVEGGRTSKVYMASEAISYLSNQAKLCTVETLGGVVIAGAAAVTIVAGMAGAAIAAFAAQWASAYSTAKVNVERKCKEFGTQNWLVGIDEEYYAGWLTITLW